ncbi:MAG TPA: branched-chain amino acid ABC transporter permease [Archaeoglobaceae archaeon]|nr:branched-chain amino acid ABC transporter permease [Archaeoglobaceae archaeon]
MLDVLLKIVVFGTIVSGIWALVASGFTLIFGVARILNFAHGTLFVLSAYLGIILVKAGLNHYLSFLIALLLVGVIGVTIYRLFMSPIREHEVMIIIVTLAIALLVEQILLLSFGETGISFPSLVRGVVKIGNLPVPTKRIIALIIAVIALILLEIFINRTVTGKKINAASQDMQMATLVGIEVEKIFMLTMFISALLAGLGGLLYSQIYAINPHVAVKSLIYAFAIVILGGLGSIRGSIVASFIVGYILMATVILLGARWSELVMLLTIIGILIVRPSGLFGVEE